ncbi:MAG: GatB/YqeY domain-containing protein [Acidiferrobacterales bacterium]
MSLKERITEDMKQALRAREQDRLRAIRLLQAAIQRQEVDQRTALDDAGITATVEKLIKQSRDALEHFTKAGREDLIAMENGDIAVWQAYLPEPLSDDELDELIDQAIKDTGASSMKEMGKVMGTLKPKVQGRADMAKVSGKLKTKLSAG